MKNKKEFSMNSNNRYSYIILLLHLFCQALLLATCLPLVCHMLATHENSRQFTTTVQRKNTENTDILGISDVL